MTIDTFSLSPPPEVHVGMAVAASAYEQLQSRGRELSFQIDDRTGKVRIEVHNLRGDVLFTVSPSKALEVAAGAGLD